MRALCIVALLILAGCGGPPREVRVAIESTAGGLVTADALVAAEVERRGEEMRLRVRAERRAGELGQGCVSPDEDRAAHIECVVQAADERFEELMSPTTDARRVLRTILARDEAGRPTGVLATLEAAADAWERGTSDAAGFAAVAACVGVTISEGVAALANAEIEVPDLLSAGADLLRGLAASMCREGK